MAGVPKIDWSSLGCSSTNAPMKCFAMFETLADGLRFAFTGYAQLGSRGISVLFSSGDAGVGSNGTCFSNVDKKKKMFIPEFPTSCPWVTSVGGTQGFEPEVAV